jgi:hypothetical protein
MAKVTRLRPRRHDVICESIQLVLDLPLDLPQEARDSIAEALGKFVPPESWPFTMMNPDQIRLVVKAIDNGPRPLYTFKIWNVAISHIRYDTGEIMASRARLAEDAGISPAEASRALARLTEIGALLKLRRGRYAINPHVGWAGSLYKRDASAKVAQPLKLIKRDDAP